MGRIKQGGFVLIEVIFASALLLIVILGLAQTMTIFQKEAAGLRIEMEFLRFGNFPSLFLSFPTQCTSAIAGQPFNPGTSTPVVYKDVSGALISAGTVFNQMTFLRVELSDLGTTGVPNQFNASLFFQAKKPAYAGGPPIMNLKAPVRVFVNAGVVQICF